MPSPPFCLSAVHSPPAYSQANYDISVINAHRLAKNDNCCSPCCTKLVPLLSQLRPGPPDVFPENLRELYELDGVLS